jgi:hypothetical protein
MVNLVDKINKFFKKEKYNNFYLENLRVDAPIPSFLSVNYCDFKPVYWDDVLISSFYSKWGFVFPAGRKDWKRCTFGLFNMDPTGEVQIKVPTILRDNKDFYSEYIFVAGHEEGHLLHNSGNSDIILNEYNKFYKRKFDDLLKVRSIKSDKFIKTCYKDENNFKYFDSFEHEKKKLFKIREYFADLAGLVALNKEYLDKSISKNILNNYENLVFNDELFALYDSVDVDYKSFFEESKVLKTT